MLSEIQDVRTLVESRYPPLHVQETRDGISTLWLSKDVVPGVLKLLKECPGPFAMLYDLTCVDERVRRDTPTGPSSQFTIVYLLLSLDRNEFVRVKVPLTENPPQLCSVTHLWPNANWYEREIWDLFGVGFEGHPHLERLLMPKYWKGHPLRKEHPARATEMGPFELTDALREEAQTKLTFDPAHWGMKREEDGTEFLFLNVGPQHPGTHGLLRLVLQLDGERIVDMVPDIGFHHRAAEKMGERQSWHTFIPYTDRVDYLAGVLNNLAYVLAVEKLAAIQVPERTVVMRVMLCELFRIISHLVWYGTFAQDVGAMSPVFYLFNDRERAFSIVEAFTGGRMHPSWFRIGGVAQDLPNGWERLIRDFLDYLPKRLDEYEAMVLKNRIFKKRTVGVGAYSLSEAVEWGVTGPGLRACGLEWDFRKNMPYGGYDQFEFEIPTALHGDCYDRSLVRVEEIRQSLRIIEQCLENMPSGPYKSDHPLATPPRKAHTLRDIETLIHHFLGVSWGPVIPAGEAMVGIESSKGSQAYYLVSDGGIASYRTRIRTPSFAHIQMMPFISRDAFVSDLIAILGSVDFVLAEVDR